MTRRRITLTTALVAIAALLAGCFSYIKEDSASQIDVMNPVRVTTTVCPSTLGFFGEGDVITRRRPDLARAIFTDDPNECATHDEVYELVYGTGGELALPRQLLLAYRVPAGAEVSSTLGADVDVLRLEDVFDIRTVRYAKGRLTGSRLHDDVEGLPAPVRQHLRFHRTDELAPSMEAYYAEGFEAQEVDGDLVGDGERLVTYVSDVVPGVITDEFKLSADFALPENEDGTPYAGPFEHETFMGMRVAFEDDLLPARSAVRAEEEEGPFDPDRPVVCPNDDIEESLTFCPIPHFDDAEADIADALEGITTETRDLRVFGGAPVTVEAGQTATVPFTIKANGPASELTVGLGADVSIQDGKATTRDPVWHFPGTGEYEQPVTVQVPHYTEPGEYVVRLAAEKERVTRDAIATLIVTARPTPQQPQSGPPPARTPDNLYLRGGGVPFGYICLAAPAQCANTYAELWLDPSAFGPRAVAAQVADAGLVRAGVTRFRAKKGKRVEAKVTLGRKARRALKRGRTLRGRLVIRSGGRTAPAVQTRGVVIRVKRKK